MKNKFHAISMCSLMAAFATSSWAASNCPTGDGWSEVNGVCYYDIQDGEQTPTIPSSLKSFKLRYKGDVDIAHAIVNLDNPDGKHHTYSVTGTAHLENGGLLTIKNRLNLKLYVSMLSPATQNEMASYSSYNCESCNIAKETGFNALTVEFEEGIEDNDQSFELTVMEEPFDFTSLEVYYTKGVDPDQVNTLVSAAQFAVVLGAISAEDLAKVPINKIKEAIDAGYESVALLHGNGENDKLTSIPADIDVDYVYLDRKFTANGKEAASTIALPFGIATDNIEGALEILKFSRVANNTLYMKAVYCSADNENTYCPAKNGKDNGSLEAYKPYLVRLNSGASTLEFSGATTLVKTPAKTEFDASNGDWAFRGMFEKKTWNENDPELTGCNGGCAYGYAAEGENLGKFVRVGEGASIVPFRGYLVNTNSANLLAPANASYVLRPTVNTPDELDIAVEGDNNQTTVIGKFNTRTGEMRMNSMKHTYDLKGRRVNGTNNARGAYYGKKVLMK